jgi:toluene monooxygenase electron transfer component
MVHVDVVAKNRGYRFAVEPDEPVLFAGLRCGLDLPYACATGTCGTCRAKIISGHARSAWPDALGLPQSRTDQDVLLCQCIPMSDVAVEVNSTIQACNLDGYGPQHYRALLASWHILAPGVATFACDLERPMTQLSRDSKRLDLLIKRKPGGAFSTWLFTQAASGAPLKVFGPLGRATFEPDCGKNLLIIAGGSGIAGMMAILERAIECNYFSQYCGNVFFGVKTWADVFFLDKLAALTRAAARRLSITVALSDGEIPQSAHDSFPTLRIAAGLVHDVARAQMCGQYENMRAYVAGPPQAVNAALRYLIRDARLSPANIRYDKFS